jgi:aminoglycoside phosphotransferase (APT) family kinase protein
VHLDQVHIDIEIAERTIRSQFPEYRNDQVVPVESSGTVNAIFRIASKSAAGFPLRKMDPGECAQMLRAEASAMIEFAGLCPFATPRPLALGKPSAWYPMPWKVQTWIDGSVATPDGLCASEAFARDLVQLVSALRRGDVGDRRFSGNGRGGSIAAHDEWMRTCFTNSEHILDVARLRRMWARFRDLPRARPDAMSHKDLIPANLLVANGRLIGVLDGGSFGPADPSLDLVVAWHLLDRERRALFHQAIEADQLDWRRGAAWAFQQAMGLVWYYRRSNPAMSALGASTISRLLEEADSLEC